MLNVKTIEHLISYLIWGTCRQPEAELSSDAESRIGRLAGGERPHVPLGVFFSRKWAKHCREIRKKKDTFGTSEEKENFRRETSDARSSTFKVLKF